MVVLSLFDGISAGQLALERAGITVDQYYACEIDKYAISITQKNFPDTIQLGDIKNWQDWDIPTPDLILAGFPCQAWSVAGNQKGDNDPRGALVHDLLAIKNHYNPEFYLFENVKMKREFIDYINNLFGCEPTEINSALVSAQNRKRLYWCNWPVTQPEDKGVLLKDVIETGHVDRDKAYCVDANYFKGGNLKSYFEKHRRQLVFSDKDNTKYRKLTPLECERLQTFPDCYTEGVSNTQRYKAIGNSWTVDVITHILNCSPTL